MKIQRQQKITNYEVTSRVGSTRNIIQLIMERKLNLFVHICRMDDQRLMKNRMFWMVDGTSLRWRSSRVWMDHVKDWCNTDIHTLSRMAQERLLWGHVVKSALDTNGRWAHGLMMMMMMIVDGWAYFNCTNMADGRSDERKKLLYSSGNEGKESENKPCPNTACNTPSS